jgi:hypothetical protein
MSTPNKDKVVIIINSPTVIPKVTPKVYDDGVDIMTG